MKLARGDAAGAERPALVDSMQQLGPLDQVIADIVPEALSPLALASLARIDQSSLPLIEGSPRCGPPVSGIGKLFAIGLNYKNYAVVSDNPVPAEPVIFKKALSCIAGPNDDVGMPGGSTKMDWEIELGEAIATGRPAGLGLGMKPPRFLGIGDERFLTIQGLGEQRQRAISPPLTAGV